MHNQYSLIEHSGIYYFLIEQSHNFGVNAVLISIKYYRYRVMVEILYRYRIEIKNLISHITTLYTVYVEKCLSRIFLQLWLFFT